MRGQIAVGAERFEVSGATRSRPAACNWRAWVRRVHVRHARLRGQRAVPRPPPRRARGDEQPRTGACSARAPSCTCRTRWACRRGTRSARPARLRRRPARRRPRASPSARQRRRHADDDARGDRRPRRALFPAVMVSTAMQGGCTCENAPVPPHRRRQHRPRRPRRPATARHGRRERLDEGDHDEGVPRAAGALQDARRARRPPVRQGVRPLRAQLQRRQPHTALQLPQQALQAQTRRAGDRARLPPAVGRGDDGVDEGSPQAAGEKVGDAHERAARPLDDRGQPEATRRAEADGRKIARRLPHRRRPGLERAARPAARRRRARSTTNWPRKPTGAPTWR